MYRNVSTDRLIAMERSLRANRTPMFSATDGGKFLKITNSNGSSFKMPMPRGDSVLIEGLAARKIAEAAGQEIINQHTEKKVNARGYSAHQNSPVFSSLAHGRLLKIALNDGRHSFVIAMPDGLSPLVEGLATRRWGINR